MAAPDDRPAIPPRPAGRDLHVVDELDPARALAWLVGDRGPLLGAPVHVVDLDDPSADATPPAPTTPVVVIGVAARATRTPPPDLDVLIATADDDPPRPWVHADPAAVLAAIAGRPETAVVLAQLLRASEPLDPNSALVVESLAYSTLQAGREHQDWLTARGARAHDDTLPPAVRARRDGDTLHITLDRPSARNAVDTAVRDGLTEALGLALADPTIARIRLDGAGESFSAGGDLSEFGSRPDPLTGHLVRTTRSVAALLHATGPRLHVTVHGAAVGAGMEMAAFAHTLTATPTAFFGLPELGLGLIPGAGGTVSIPRRIGRARTAYLALTGERITVRRAHDWGLVDAVIE
jgi:hypothetical protein